MAKVSIANKEYELRYLLQDKREIEKALDKWIYKALWSGLSEDMNVILAVGLKRKHPQMRTPLAVEEQLQKHIDKGHDLSDVHKGLIRAVFESNIMGRTEPAEIDRLIKNYFGDEAPKEQGGEAPPA